MALYVKTGEFTGTGSGSVTVNLTFTPKAVFIWGPAQSTTTTFNPRVKTDTMSANNSGSMPGSVAIYTDGNLTFSGDSFVCAGTSTNGLNISSKVYYWLALGGTDCVTGAYTGDGTDNRNITGLGINPDFVFIRGSVAQTAVYKTSSTGKTTDTSIVLNTLVPNTNRIQQLITDGFQVGSNAQVNSSGATFNYIAIQTSAVSGIFAEGTYTGNNTDNRSITGIGFNPNFVLVKGIVSGDSSRTRTVESGDSASSWTQTNGVANTIQQFVTDGFEVGTSTDVNRDTSTFYWFAFKENEPSGSTVNSNFLAFM